MWRAPACCLLLLQRSSGLRRAQALPVFNARPALLCRRSLLQVLRPPCSWISCCFAAAFSNKAALPSLQVVAEAEKAEDPQPAQRDM